MYYASFGILSIVIHFIINFEIMKKPRETEDKDVRASYRAFLFSLTLYYISDILWGTLYDLRIRPLAYADTVLYFAAMAFSVLMWTRYVVKFLRQKGIFGAILTYAGWAIFTFEVIVLSVNYVAPIVFSFDDTSEYMPLPARYITLAVQIVLYFITSVYALVSAVRSDGKSRTHFISVGISGLIMTVFIMLQTNYPLLPFYAIGCLIATCFIHSMVIQDVKADLDRKLGTAEIKAYIDPLTGVKNKLAYMEAARSFNNRISDGECEEFGIVIFDLNDLKLINDTKGHESGDKYIKTACEIICEEFRHSPVFRIGGDEFAALLEGEDYNNREALIHSFEKQIDNNVRSNHIVIAEGMGVFDPGTDESYEAVFARADKKMYERKGKLKDKAAKKS